MKLELLLGMIVFLLVTAAAYSSDVARPEIEELRHQAHVQISQAEGANAQNCSPFWLAQSQSEFDHGAEELSDNHLYQAQFHFKTALLAAQEALKRAADCSTPR